MSSNNMQRQRKKSGSQALCCSICRVSVSEDRGAESFRSSSDRNASISTLAHYLIQEKLNQMIKESEEDDRARSSRERKGKQKRVAKHDSTSKHSSNRKLVMMVAMEKRTFDPREDFRQSMIECILAKGIEQTKDLRYLLKCYLSMNSEEYREIILEVFHQVFSQPKQSHVEGCEAAGADDLLNASSTPAKISYHLQCYYIPKSSLSDNHL